MTENTIPKPRLRRGPYGKWHCRGGTPPYLLGVGDDLGSAYAHWLEREATEPMFSAPGEEFEALADRPLWLRIWDWLCGSSP